MDIFSKIKWIAGILLVFVVVLTTNLIDKDNFNRLRYSVVTIYEDRIVASDLIFQISQLIQEKEMAVAMSDSLFFRNRSTQVRFSIRSLIERYEQTKLTDEERKLLRDLKQDLQTLEKLEESYLTSGGANQTAMFSAINSIDQDLADLSKVQLEEGKKQMALSNKTMETIDLFTQVEIIALILMAVLVQIIILYKPKD